MLRCGWTYHWPEDSVYSLLIILWDKFRTCLSYKMVRLSKLSSIKSRKKLCSLFQEQCGNKHRVWTDYHRTFSTTGRVIWMRSWVVSLVSYRLHLELVLVELVRLSKVPQYKLYVHLSLQEHTSWSVYENEREQFFSGTYDSGTYIWHRWWWDSCICICLVYTTKLVMG